VPSSLGVGKTLGGVGREGVRGRSASTLEGTPGRSFDGATIGSTPSLVAKLGERDGLVRAAAREALIEHGAERVDVHARVDPPLAAELLGAE